MLFHSLPELFHYFREEYKNIINVKVFSRLLYFIWRGKNHKNENKKKKTARLIFICLATKINYPKSHYWYGGTHKKRRWLFSREKQLIASDTQWHRTNPLNNAQRHSQYKPLIQSGGPAAAHESFQPWSYSLQMQLMLNQIASHQSKAVQSISQHTKHSASITLEAG